MLESLPEIKIEDINLIHIAENRTRINGIIAYLSVVASSLAPTPHLKNKSGDT